MNNTIPNIVITSSARTQSPHIGCMTVTASFKCCRCNQTQVWDGMLMSRSELMQAQTTPAIWQCDDCQQVRDEIAASRY